MASGRPWVMALVYATIQAFIFHTEEGTLFQPSLLDAGNIFLSPPHWAPLSPEGLIVFSTLPF